MSIGRRCLFLMCFGGRFSVDRSSVRYLCGFILFAAGLVPPLHGYPVGWDNPRYLNNQVVYLADLGEGSEGVGTVANPLNASGARFDRILREFWDLKIPNVTFKLSPGIYETHAKGQGGDPTHSLGRYWEPWHGWRILGSGTNETVIRQVGTEKTGTKHAIILAGATGGTLRHFELGHLRLDANGMQLARTNESNFGCISIEGSDIHLHDLLCVGSVNALARSALLPNGAAEFRELFIVRVGAPSRPNAQGVLESVSNNVVERCTVVASPPTYIKPVTNRFGDIIVPLTTGIVLGAQVENYAHHCQILDCLVDGLDPHYQFNAIGLQGCSNSWALGNVIRNAQRGFYKDDGLLTPSVFVVGNVFTNVINGVFFNHSDNQQLVNPLRVEKIVVLSNRIYTAINHRVGGKSASTTGIYLLSSEAIRSFGSVVIGQNTILPTEPRFDPTDLDDVGIAIFRTTNSWVFSNFVQMPCDAHGIVAEQTEGVRFFCRNVSSRGPLRAYADDRACNSQGADALEESCPAEGSGFEFALARLPDLPIFPAQPLVSVWRWDAGTASTLKMGMQRVEGGELATGSLDGSLITSATANQGIAEYRFQAPHLPGWPSGTRPFWVWLRVSSFSSDQRLSLVELDGEASVFDSWLNSNPTSHSTVFRWVVLRARKTGQGIENNPIRPWLLSPGEHQLRIHTKGTHLRIDELALSDAPPEVFTLNDVLARTATRPLTVASDVVWEVGYDLLQGRVESPMTIHRDPAELGRPCLEMTALGRGSVELSVEVPRLAVYELLLSVRTQGTGYGSCYLGVDGVERVVLPSSPLGDWHTTGRVGLTEAAARSIPSGNSSAWKVSLTPGRHIVRIRSRVPGLAVDQLFMRESTVDSP